MSEETIREMEAVSEKQHSAANPSVSSLEYLARTNGYEISFTVDEEGQCDLTLKTISPYHSGPRTFRATSGILRDSHRYKHALEVAVTRMLDYEFRLTPDARPPLDAGDVR